MRPAESTKPMDEHHIRQQEPRRSDAEEEDAEEGPHISEEDAEEGPHISVEGLLRPSPDAEEADAEEGPHISVEGLLRPSPGMDGPVSPAVSPLANKN